MEAGPVIRKAAIKDAAWIKAYEQQNVDVGLRCGLPGRAQIGKGRWTMPDLMRAMIQSKDAHPRAGANTAWVPSPTAATLHALHYHEVDVAAVQRSLAGRPGARLEDLLTPPLLEKPYTATEIDEELRNNAQSILGYRCVGLIRALVAQKCLIWRVLLSWKIGRHCGSRASISSTGFVTASANAFRCSRYSSAWLP